MVKKIKSDLGFPYAKQYETGYNQSMVRSMYKPLLVVVILVVFLLLGLIVFCLYMLGMPDADERMGGILRIHLVFLAYTMLFVLLAVIARRKAFEHPKVYLAMCNSYAVGICVWSSVLSAYAYAYDPVFTAFIYVSLCLSLVSLFKPWLAIVVFTSNFIFYNLLVALFVPAADVLLVNMLNSGLAAGLSMAIAIVMYRHRTRTYYANLIVVQQSQEIKKMNEKLQVLVHIDELTTLFNRRYFDDMLPKAIEEMVQEGKGVCAIMADIDHFKDYNDLYGHQAGDNALRRVAAIVRQTLPEKDTHIVRYGGEELFVLLPLENEMDGMETGEKVRKAIESEYIEHLASKRGILTISVGVAVCPPGQSCTLGRLVAGADEALYRAKAKGRNTVIYSKLNA